MLACFSTAGFFFYNSGVFGALEERCLGTGAAPLTAECTYGLDEYFNSNKGFKWTLSFSVVTIYTRFIAACAAVIPGIDVPLLVFSAASNRIPPILLCCCVFNLAFAIMFTVLYGYSYDFRNVLQSFFSVFRAIGGDLDVSPYQLSQDRHVAPLFLNFYVFVNVFFILTIGT